LVFGHPKGNYYFINWRFSFKNQGMYDQIYIYKQNGEMCSLVFKHPTNLIFYPLVSKPLIVSRFSSEASCTIDKSITSTKDPKNQGNRTRDFVVPSSF
jgi:hypothetical protein